MTSLKWRPLLAIRTWAAIFSAVCAVLLAGGYLYFRVESQRIRQEQYKNLFAIARMKSELIEDWRRDRAADAEMAAGGTLLIRHVRSLVEGSQDPVIQKELSRILDIDHRRGYYALVAIVGADGRPLISLPGNGLDLDLAASRALVAEAATGGKARLGDLYRASNGKIWLDVAAPILDENRRVLGVILLRSDAAAELFPLIQSWPTPSRSAETLLVRRDGDKVIFLNQLRHCSDTALALNSPLSQKDRPAVQAVLGQSGSFLGVDYRGVKVLADLRPVPDSPWFMVTKVDAAEILAEARYRAYAISVVVAIAISLAGALVAYAYRRRQAGVYQALFESERQKRLSREKFRTILYSIGDGIITADTESRVCEMNRVAEAMTGWTEEEAQGKELDEVFRIINQETRARVVNPVGKVLREGGVVGLANHTLLICRDGTERAIADSAAPICDDAGKVSGVVLVFSDVTGKYRVEAALKKSEQAYRMLFESMLDGCAVHEIVCDDAGKPIDYRFLSVNPAFERTLGMRARDIVGRTVREAIPGIEPDWIELYGRVALSGEPLQIEQYSPVLKRHFKVAAFSPKKNQFATIFADITERKMAEEALRESEVRFRGLFQSISSVAVRSFGLDDKVQYWNKASELLYGYTEQEVIGKNAMDLIVPPETRRQVEKLDMAQIAQSGADIPSIELVMKRKDGSPVTVISHLAVVKTPGRPPEFFCLDIDITERKRLEAHFLRAQRMESIGTLASGVAHDLNNILAPIILSADLLRNETAPAARAGLIDTIEICAQRGANVVNQVLTFARGARGDKVVLQLGHLVEEMVKIARETFPKNIVVVNHASGELWPVKGNATQMHQVLLNLCVNARDAMPEGGILTFVAQNETIDANFAAMIPEAKPGAYATVEIADTGVGIPPEVIGKIFDPFFTTKEVGKGTGLGLSTVAGIVRGHGGFISVASEPGRGTQFKVCFPADCKAASDPSLKKRASRPGAGQTILVVDDDSPVCQTIGTVLELNGYKVLTAADGPQALSLFKDRAGEIQLVLTDLSMPGMSGVELIHELQKIAPSIKVIASSGQVTDENKIHLKTCRVRTLLHKPYDAGKLLAAVAAALAT